MTEAVISGAAGRRIGDINWSYPWQSARADFLAGLTVAAISLPQIATRHALAGAEIVNCVRAACLLALDAGGSLITEAMLQRAIRRELAKDGREH